METARQVSRDLRNTEGVDLIIAITHMDTQEDLALLAQVSEVDVIIGGHTVGFDGLRTPNLPGAIPKLQHPGRVFVKTHRQGRTVGRLELEIAKPSQGRVKILHATSENIAVDHTLALNPGVAELIEAYDRKLDAEADVVLGRTLVHLRGATEQVRSQETNLGNLLADILRERFGAEVALVNAGQIRGSIPPGPVNFRRVLSVLPFDSPTCTLTLTGTQIRRALENSVSRLPSLNGRFLQVSGLSFAFDPSQLPGQRIQGINVGTAPLIPSRRYTVALPTFLAEGGDGYGVLGAGENRINRGVPMRDLFLEALQQGPIKASVSGRIQRSGMPPLLR